MGQEGTRRWAWGKSDADVDFPKWDYRRILAHYYSEVRFIGVSPVPPDSFRGNIVEVIGIPPNGNLTICKGEERTGINVLYQNVGPNPIPVNSSDFAGFCSGISNPSTLLGYHLYQQNGTQACPNCIGLRASPLCFPEAIIPPGRHHVSYGFKVFIPNDPSITPGNTYFIRFDVRYNGTWQGRSTNFPWPPQDVPVTICGASGGGPGAIIDYPPAVVTSANLVNGRYGFSWSPKNGAETFDLEYRSKEIGQADYPPNFVTLLSNSPAQQFSATVGCNQDRLDWQFRLRGSNSSGDGDWNYIQSQTRVYPHPWPSYWSIAGLALNSNPGPWPRANNILNLGGGRFNWTATDDRSWISTNSSGQSEGSLGTVISKPGGIGDYSGTITVNIANPQPMPNCGPSTFQIPVTLSIRNSFETYYLPIILKNSP